MFRVYFEFTDFHPCGKYEYSVVNQSDRKAGQHKRLSNNADDGGGRWRDCIRQLFFPH